MARKAQTKGFDLKSFVSDNLLWILIIGMVAVGSVSSKTFLTLANMKNFFYSMTVFGFIALGQSMVMLVSELNLAQGALIAFAPTMGTFIAQKILETQGINILVGGNYITGGLWIGAIATILVGLVVGLLMGVIIVKLNVSSLVTTLGVSYALGGLAYLFFNGYSLYMNNLPGYEWLGNTYVLNLPISFVFLILVSILLMLAMKFTRFGRNIYATGGNERAAIYSGINTKKWKIIAFMISGTLAAFAGLIYSSRTLSIGPTQGTGYQMYALAIATVGGVSMEGGRGTLFGTLQATLIVALVFNVMSLMGLFAWWQTMFIGAIILVSAIQQAYSRNSLV